MVMVKCEKQLHIYNNEEYDDCPVCADSNHDERLFEMLQNEARQKQADKDMVIGAVLCVGGLIASAANFGYVFIGAIVYGGMLFLKGAILSSKAKSVRSKLMEEVDNIIPDKPVPQQNCQAPLQANTKLDQFRIVKALGQGGFDITYLAIDEKNNQQVVIKEYFPRNLAYRSDGDTQVELISQEQNKYQDYENGRNRFEQEAMFLGGFTHSNIVKVLSLFAQNNTCYCVMEYIEGQSLREYQRYVKRPFTEKEIYKYCLPILEALDFIHKNNFLHLNVNPDAILIDTVRDKPILIDFDAVREIIDNSDTYESMLGLYGYSPVEQYSMSGDKTPATVLYAFGMTLYNLIAPEIELPKSTDRQVSIFDDLDDPLPNIREVAKGYSEGLYQLIEQCTQIRQKDRPQSVAEVRKILQSCRSILLTN